MRPALLCLLVEYQLAIMTRTAENYTIALAIIRQCLNEKDYFLLEGVGR